MPLLLVASTCAATSEPAGRLGYWRFNTLDWRDESGRLPLATSNPVRAPSFDGFALSSSSGTGAGVVRFRGVDPAGQPVLHPTQGSVRFLYKPYWATADQVPRLPGTTPPPPGRWLRLFEAGVQNGGGDSGRWMISIDPAGTNLVVHTHDSQGRALTNFQARISWSTPVTAKKFEAGNPPTDWHEIVLNYTPATCSLVLDGAAQQDWFTRNFAGQGLPRLDVLTGVETAFSLGVTLAGEHPAEGLFDELETYDRPLSPLRTYAALARTGFHASIATAPLNVTLSWFTTGNDRRSLRRLELGQPTPLPLASNLTGMSFTDTNGLRLGAAYMYQLDGQSLIVGLNSPPSDRRGRVIVLVDRTLATGIRTELDLFLTDLAGDGWTVVRHDVPRHNDAAWTVASGLAGYRSDLAGIKALVAADYRAAPDQTAALILVGHVTIPYSGSGAEDGHADHFGAWPADAYYGDLEGEWTDTAAGTPATVQNPLLRNVPGDGKFDPVTFPKPTRVGATRSTPGLDLAVGRIDFARLPAYRPKSEADLLRQYLGKNHRYRHKTLTFEQNALVGGYFGNPYHTESTVLYHMANLLAYRLYRPGLRRVFDGNAFAGEASAVWAVQGGYGDPTALHNSPDMNKGLGLRRVATTDLAQSRVTPRVAFYVLKGSYFGDWNYTDDNFLRALLATPDSGLAALWTRVAPWALDLTGLGEPLAATLVATSRGSVTVRQCSLLGDPTLRPFVTAPPGRLTAARSGGAVRLTWAASPDAEQGYLISRSAAATGSFQRVNAQPELGSTFLDQTAPAGPLFYQVRACQLITTGCGAFTNTSQGITVEVRR